MKKTLLYLFLCVCSSAFSQLLQSDNFNSLTIGNVGTVFTGASVGQGGWYTESSNGATPTTSSNAGNSNFQIVSTGNSSNGLQVQGPNGDKGARFLWKAGLTDLWAARSSGNNIIEMEVDINPGAGTTTSENTFGIYLYNTGYSRTLAAFEVKAKTRELFLVAYSTPAGQTVDNYIYPLAAAPGIQLPSNTFSRIGISYNKTTGVVRIKGPGLPVAGLTLNGSSSGSDPFEINIVSLSGHTTAAPNSSSATVIFDNFISRASSTDTLLSTDSNVITNNTFTVYPNPTSSILNISNPNNVEIKNISVVDINGRIVKSQSDSLSQINVSDLNAGVYFITIEAAEGKTTKKFIKQ
jgi:hypothetical protein